MSVSLAQRLHALVRSVLDSYPGAWLAWCDPQGQWKPLLERAATLDGGFALVSIQRTHGWEPGRSRRTPSGPGAAGAR